MIDRYPHSDQCPVRPLLARKNGMPCTCGATAQQSAFEAGKREADARAMAVVEEAIQLVEGGPLDPRGDRLVEALMAGRFIDTKGRRL